MQNLIFQKLIELDIEHKTYYHEPLFTCDQAIAAASTIPATQCKNLFLKDNKKQLYLVVAVSDVSHETIIQLKGLAKFLQAPGLRFADSQLLQRHLGVQPGSVTPFGLIFDNERLVKVILDSTLFNYNQIGFHPLENSATTVIKPQDLITFLNASGNCYVVVDFTTINEL